jgi:16S rRNA (uracil1498-N3)-methyltransferase
MHRFYLPPENCSDKTLSLAGREAHHAAQVLRIHPGEPATVLDGAGHEYLCTVVSVTKKNIELAVRQKNFIAPLPCQLTLIQAVPKGKIIEAIIQKATELGVARIVPVLSDRVVVQLDQESAEEKVSRWQQTAIEAIKQCGQPWLPKIEKPQRPKDFLAREEKFDLPLVASLQPGSQHPRKFFRAFVAEKKRPPASVGMWVGPEGDFTPAELGAIKSAGALPISLGRLVLRCETAAVFCLSILNYELQLPESPA